MAQYGKVSKTKKIVKSMEKQHKPARWARVLPASLKPMRTIKNPGRGR